MLYLFDVLVGGDIDEDIIECCLFYVCDVQWYFFGVVDLLFRGQLVAAAAAAVIGNGADV